MMAAAKPIIQKIAPLPVPPFLLDEKIYDVLSEDPPLDMNVAQPLRTCWARPEIQYVTDFV